MPETPMLDLERDPPKQRHAWATLLFAVAVAVAVVGLNIHIDLWWIPLLYVGIAIHELGHLAAGKLAGMNPAAIMVGGLKIFKSGDRWICRFDFRQLLGGGVAAPLARKGHSNGSKAFMVAGGPLATLLLAVIGGVTSGWTGSLCSINLFLLASTMLPVQGVNKSDIPRIWQLLRDRQGAQSWAALIQIQTQDMEGVLPRDWDPEIVAQMLHSDPKSGDYAYRQLLAFYRQLDLGDSELALQHLETALATSAAGGNVVQHLCFLEASASSALYRHNAAAAHTWLARAIKVRRAVTKNGAEAAIAQSEGRYQDALRYWDAAQAYLAKKKLDSGLVRFARRIIADHQQECRQALSAAQATAGDS